MITKWGMTGAAALAMMAGNQALAADSGTNWLTDTISPVCNPIFFEDAKVDSEVHPVYMYHYLPANFKFNGGSAPVGGDVQVMAVQLRYALTDRLGIIATKDGYIEFQPEHSLAHHYGFADLAAGLKYVLINAQDSRFILTPGFTVNIPTGSHDVYQGYGSGEWNIFTSAEKGFDKLHILGNVGVRIPDNFAQETCQLHYSAQVDYYLWQYCIPFVAVNGYSVLSDGNRNLIQGVPLNTELYDLINSGSTAAYGRTQLTIGGGFRTRILKNLDAGVAYEGGIAKPVGIFEGRITADVVWRF